jgi:HlyD family secretion protein
VLFTVDAYPDDLFEGSIFQVRMNPATVQNVVTYTVVVEAPNPELKLLPGMTAKLSFQIDKHEKVLKVPNAALRFYPKAEQVRPEDRELLEGVQEESGSKEGTEGLETQRSAMERSLARKGRNRRHAWVEENGLLRAIALTIGLTDSRYSEVLDGQLVEGQEVVTGIGPQTP